MKCRQKLYFFYFTASVMDQEKGLAHTQLREVHVYERRTIPGTLLALI
jgi:hypothetical protein